MPQERTILHCDCNSFYASVESLERPELRAVPMAVCGDPKSRHGIILAKNELAKGFGVRTAETVGQALKKCPQLTLVPPHRERYERVSRLINAIYGAYTDQVEPFSIDESWLDVTGSLHLFGTGEQIAHELRRRVREEVGVTISVGVSFNKIFAKLGSDYRKPDATTVITRENFRQILWPLPAEAMMFVGHAAAEALAGAGIRTIGDMAAAGKERLRAVLGSAGETLWTYAMGLDGSRVRRADETPPPRSIGCGTTFSHDLAGERALRAGLLPLCERVGARLRAHKLYCTTVQVQIRDPFFKTVSRQQRLPAPTSVTRELYEAAAALVLRQCGGGAPVRMLTVTATGLTDCCAAQMRLIGDGTEAHLRGERLDSALDGIRARFGEDAIAPARTLGRRDG